MIARGGDLLHAVKKFHGTGLERILGTHHDQGVGANQALEHVGAVSQMVGRDANVGANRLPDDLTGRQCFLIDPMLATGGTLVAATHYLAERGAKDVTAVCILAAPEGIEFVEKNIDPSIDFKVVVCAVDEGLNEKAYIVPGLGDAGDRLYGVID